MKSKNRYVFDTNVIVSALLFSNSVPEQVFARVLTPSKTLESMQQ